MNELFALLEILAASLLGAKITYVFAHRYRMNPVRAAGLASLIFISIGSLSKIDPLLRTQGAFFGSTFVAMSEPKRLSERQVLGAGAVFGVVYFLLLKMQWLSFHGGMGGTLGGTAFVSCLVIYFGEYFLFQRIFKTKRVGKKA